MFKTVIATSLLLLTLLLNSTATQAQSLGFDNVSEDDLKKIVSDLSSNFTHTSVSGAGALGTIFGFELGVVGGMTSTSELDKLVKSYDASASADQAIHGGILGMLSVPLGLTAEALFVPAVGSEDFKFNTLSLALKWTMTDTVLSGLPVDLAVKFHMNQTGLKFKQVISPDPYETELEFKNQILGAQLLVSKSLVLVTPYAGLGMLQSEGELSFSGSSGNIFDSTYTTSTSAKVKASSSQFLAGVELNLLLLKAGLEISRQFSADRITGKIAFSF